MQGEQTLLHLYSHFVKQRLESGGRLASCSCGNRTVTELKGALTSWENVLELEWYGFPSCNRGGPNFIRESPFHYENGDLGSPSSWENGHFHIEIGTHGPHLEGPHFHMILALHNIVTFCDVIQKQFYKKHMRHFLEQVHAVGLCRVITVVGEIYLLCDGKLYQWLW